MTATSSTSSTNASQCHWCERVSEKKLLKCGTCLVARYCDQRCQIVHWPEHKKVCHSPHNATTDVTKSVVTKTLLGHAQAEHTTDSFNHLNTTLAPPLPPIAEPKKEDSMPTSCDSAAKCKTPHEQLQTRRIAEQEVAALHQANVYFAKDNIAGACMYVLKTTSLPFIRKAFIAHFAKVMCARDKKNLSMVMKIAPQLLMEGGKECVIDALCDAKIFESREAIEQELLTTDVTKNVISKTLLNDAQAEQTTDTFNHLNTTLTVSPPPIAEPKKEVSMPASCDSSAKGESHTSGALPVFALPMEQAVHLQEATLYLQKGKARAACRYMLKNTAVPKVRHEFLIRLATMMCLRDKKNITQVMEWAPRLVEKGWREIVIDVLISAKIFASREEIEKALEHSS